MQQDDMRVLIAEDNATQRILLRAMLKRTNHEILEAVDGQEAWDILQHSVIQLVITDWMMPRMDGTELIHLIRATDFGRYIYVLLLTAKNERNDIVTGLHTGADDYLVKPVDTDELLARVGVGERVLMLETRLRTARDQFQVQAMHDHLTGLLNRQALYERVNTELSRMQRTAQSISVLLLDIDYFKRINDQYGHSVGDQALQLVARILNEEKRHHDMAARWGGEEFALVLPEMSIHEALIVAERIRMSIYHTSLTVPSGHTIALQVSIGVTSASVEEQVGLDELLNQADAALYYAKQTGRNRVCCATEIQQTTVPEHTVSSSESGMLALQHSSSLAASVDKLRDELYAIECEISTVLADPLTLQQRAAAEQAQQRSTTLRHLLDNTRTETGGTLQ
jgi:two-component system chemotaxis response regulator CheY